jgi:hypothetical protein
MMETMNMTLVVVMMTDQKPHCPTCSHAPAKEINKRYDKFDTYKYFCRLKNMWIFGTAFNTIEIVGCLSHPGAREWLMRDVIEELKRQLEKQKEIGGELVDMKRRYRYQDVALEKATLINKIISLIRDGVKG